MALQRGGRQIQVMTQPPTFRNRIALIRRGDSATLTSIARKNVDLLLRGAQAAGLGREDAADIVQETLLVFVRRCADFDGRASERTWLYGILLNKISEQRKKSRRHDMVEDIESVVAARFDTSGGVLPVQTPEAYAAGAQAIDLLNECADDLPEQKRLAFLLRDVEQLETDEICKILGVSANNLGVLLFRARNALRECMESKGIHGSADVEL